MGVPKRRIHFPDAGVTPYVVGPELPPQYTNDHLTALANFTGMPKVIFMPALGLTYDQSRRVPSEKERQYKDLFADMLKQQFGLQDQNIVNHLYAAYTGGASSSPVYQMKQRPDGGSDLVVVGAFQFLPKIGDGQALLQDLQGRTGTNIGAVGAVTPQEYALFLAAHEAGHAQAYNRRNEIELMSSAGMSEPQAEQAAIAFVKQHPDLFPNLSQPDVMQAFLGTRSMGTLFLPGGMMSNHPLIPLAIDPQNPGLKLTDADAGAFRESYLQSYGRVLLKLADYGLLQRQSDVDALGTFGDRLFSRGLNLHRDSSGLLERLLKDHGLDPQSAEARTFVAGILEVAAKAIGGDQTAAQQLSQQGITRDVIKAWTDSGQDSNLYLQMAKLKEAQSIPTNPSEGFRSDTVLDVKGTLAVGMTRAMIELQREGAFKADPNQQRFANYFIEGMKAFAPETIATAEQQAKGAPKPASPPATVVKP